MFGLDQAFQAAFKYQEQLFAEEQQNDAQQFASGQQIAAQDFNEKEAMKNRDWQERMSNTQYQRGVNDLKAAGINPMLAALHGGAGNLAGSAATTSPASAGIASPGGTHVTPFSQSAQSASQIRVNDALEDRTKAEAEKVRAEKLEIEARTPTHAVNIDRMRQQIAESVANVEKILQETSTSYWSAQNIQQQTVNLKAVLPQIQATIDQLRAQTKQTTVLTGKTQAETDEIRQRIKANLPAIESALRELEAQARQLDMPRREQERAANDRFTGSLGALLRSLNPLNNFLK